MKFIGINGLYMASCINQYGQGVDELRVLDVGSGEGRPWAVASLKIKTDVKIKLTTLDIKRANNHAAMSFVSGQVLSIKGDAIAELHKFEDGKFDLVFCHDVIEHLPKHVGYALIYDMNRVSKLAVGVATPNGFVYQQPTSDNPGQAHLSGWSVSQLRGAGFSKIRTYNGLKVLTRQYNKKLYPQTLFWSPLLILETLIAGVIPSLGANIWAETRGNPSQLSGLGPAATDELFH